MPRLPKYLNDYSSVSYGTSGSIPSDQEVSYISMVKRIGIPWKIELNESRQLQEHLNYIERVRTDPGVEEAKVMQFTKIAGYTILTDQQNKNKIDFTLTKIL